MIAQTKLPQWLTLSLALAALCLAQPKQAWAQEKTKEKPPAKTKEKTPAKTPDKTKAKPKTPDKPAPKAKDKAPETPKKASKAKKDAVKTEPKKQPAKGGTKKTEAKSPKSEAEAYLAWEQRFLKSKGRDTKARQRLLSYGMAGNRAFKALRQCFTDCDDLDVQKDICGAMASAGYAALPALRSGLRDRRELVWRWSIQCLALMALDGPSGCQAAARAELEDALSIEQPAGVALESLYALTRLQTGLSKQGERAIRFLSQKTPDLALNQAAHKQLQQLSQIVMLRGGQKQDLRTKAKALASLSLSLKIRIALEQEGPEEAYTLVEKAEKVAPKNSDYQLLKAQCVFAQKDLYSAGNIIAKLIKDNPRFSVYHYWSGKVRQTSNDLEGALGSYDKSLKLFPHNAYCLTNRGTVLRMLRNYKYSIRDLNAALAIDSSNGRIYLQRARVRWSMLRAERINYRRVEWKTVLADLDQSIKLEPSLSGAFGRRAYLHRKRAEFKASLDDYNQAIALKGADQWLWRGYRGLLLNERERFQEAIPDLEYFLEKASATHKLRGAMQRALDNCKARLPKPAAKPKEPVKPVEPVKPTKPVKPAKPVKPVKKKAKLY